MMQNEMGSKITIAHPIIIITITCEGRVWWEGAPCSECDSCALPFQDDYIPYPRIEEVRCCLLPTDWLLPSPSTIKSNKCLCASSRCWRGVLPTLRSYSLSLADTGSRSPLHLHHRRKIKKGEMLKKKREREVQKEKRRKTH